MIFMTLLFGGEKHDDLPGKDGEVRITGISVSDFLFSKITPTYFLETDAVNAQGGTNPVQQRRYPPMHRIYCPCPVSLPRHERVCNMPRGMGELAHISEVVCFSRFPILPVL